MKRMLNLKTFMIVFSFFAISAAANAAKFRGHVNITNNSSYDMKISDRWSDDDTKVEISKQIIAPGEAAYITIKCDHTLKIHRFDILVDWKNYRGNPVKNNLQFETSARLGGLMPSVFPRKGTTSFDKNYITGDTHVGERDYRKSISFSIGDNNIAPEKYTLTTVVGTGKGKITPNGTTSLWAGDNQTVTATPAADYHWASWDVNDETVQGTGNQYTVSNISANTTITANFDHDNVTVTASSGEGGSIDQTGDISVKYGSDLTLTAVPEEGYKVAYWTVDGVNKGNNLALTLSDIIKSESIQVTFFKIPVNLTSDSIRLDGSISTGGNCTTGNVDIAGDELVVGGGLWDTNCFEGFKKDKEWTMVESYELGSDSSTMGKMRGLAISDSYVLAGFPEYGSSPGSGRAFIYNFDDPKTINWWGHIGLNNIDNDPSWFANSISIDGNFGIIGGRFYNSNTGAAYMIGGINGWNGGSKILSTSDTVKGDDFGCSVSISGDYAIVGADGKTINDINNAGAVYIYQKQGGNSIYDWHEVAEVPSEDITVGARFGASVAISNDYAIVSEACSDSDPSRVPGSGKEVYIYHKNENNEWGNVTKLKVPENASMLKGPGNVLSTWKFGSQVKIDGYNALVVYYRQDGNYAVYLYRRLNGNKWDSGVEVGTSLSMYGSIAIKEDEMVIGDGNNTAYIYSNLKGNEDGWTKDPSSTEEGQVVKYTDTNGDIYYELNSDYNKSPLIYDINAALSSYNVNWKMKYPPNGEYEIIFKCETTNNGVKYIEYTNTQPEGTRSEEYNNYYKADSIKCGMPPPSSSWTTANKNLQADLAAVEPNNQITKVDSVIYNGGGFISLPDFTGVNAI